MMRKLLIFGVLLCVILCLVISLIVTELAVKTVNNTIYDFEVYQDVAIYLTLLASCILSKNKNLQVVILATIIPSDTMSYLSITQGKVVYISYALSYLMSAYCIFLSLPKYKYTILFCIMMFIFQLFMALDYYLAMELAIYENPKTLLFIHYKSILYGLHLLIICSITDWGHLQSVRGFFDRCSYFLRGCVGHHFVA